MLAAKRIKLLTTLRKLFIPYVQLPLELHPSRRTQDGVALPEYMSVSLQDL